MAGSLMQDLSFAGRALMRRPGFAALAVLTVALGIGVNTAMFSIVNGVLWKALPYTDSDRLVMFNENSTSGALNCSGPNLADWKQRSTLFDGIEIARLFPRATLRLEKTVESVTAGYAHPELFSMLGIKPVMGRLFGASEDRAGAEPVGAISYRAWQTVFNGDPNVIGKHVRAHIAFQDFFVDSFTIVAVLPDEMRFETIDLWLPLNRFWGKVDAMRGNHWFRGVGKLKPGVTVQRAQAELETIARSLEAEYPATNKGVRPKTTGMIEYYTGRVHDTLVLLLGAVGFVMLIACGNVVHLLLTRTIGRRREIAVRLALGAGRYRLLQLLLAEGFVIAVVGGALGLLLSRWALDWTIAAQPRLLPRAQSIALDGTALLYAAAITAVTFVILGLTPLWQSSRAGIAAAMQSAGRGGTDRKQRRLGWGMVAAELAMASVLLAGAGLMIQTLRNLEHVSLGYQPEGLVAAPFSLPAFKYSSEQEFQTVGRRILEEAKSVPGYVSAALAEPFQLGGNGMLPPMTVPGRANPQPAPMIPALPITSTFFETMRVPLIAGRAPSTTAPRREAVVNEKFAQRFFPGESAVGKVIDMGGPMEVVGVVANSHLQSGIVNEVAEVYWSQGTYVSPTLLLRVAGPPEKAVNAVREILKRVEPEIRIGAIQPMAAMERERNGLRLFTRTLLLIFAGLAVVLASLGIYGVVSYTVAQRTREIGIRIALGASRGEVAGMVLRQTLWATAAGAVAGAAGAAGLAQFLAAQLYGVTAREPGIYAAVIGIIALVSIAACAAPMLRASRVDPVVCLRDE